MGVISDWGVAIWTSLTGALALVFAFIPKLLGFLIILGIGWLISGLLERGVTALLRKVGFDRLADRIGLTRLGQRMNINTDAAAILGRIVFWFIFLIFLIPAVNALGLESVSSLLGSLIAYIPNVFVAILVLFLGTLAATFVSDIVRGAVGSTNVGNPNIFAAIARYAIIAFAALIALYQLQIAPAIIQTLFTAIVGALALAFGLAFGLGGREAAQRWLARGEASLTTAAAQYSAQQQTQRNINQARNIADLQSDDTRTRERVQSQPYTTNQQAPNPAYPPAQQVQGQQLPPNPETPYTQQQPPYQQ